MGRRYLIVMGAPGAGKGTQASRVAADEGLCRIATGDLLRSALAAGTPLGQEAEGYMKAGELVPDEVVLEMVDEELDRASCRAGAVFDGFPRTVEQARGLERLLAGREATLELVLVIEVPEEEIVRRLSGRRVCQNCEKLYHIEFGPPRVEGRCDACGGDLVQRPDDRPETVRRRLAVYREETQPVIDFYERETPVPVTEIDGDRPIDEVAVAIRRQLEKVEVE
ncbi:MAG TPA: adenylate kinase [Candidatus Polarisedimenticolia bacterium]|nr:adenylate kinase [Candidatus Polarisedimenticolia bacterium]